MRVLRRELGLEGTVKEVLVGAAMQLGIDPEGKPLLELARMCMHTIIGVYE